MRPLGLSLAIIAALLLASNRSGAFPITYTVTGQGSGQIGATPFTNQSFKLTCNADTTAVQMTNPGNYGVNNVSSQLQIGATSATALAGSSYAGAGDFFGYSGGVVGDEIDTFPLYVQSPGLTSYNLQSALGPLNTTTTASQFFVSTNLGDATISNLSQLTLTASVPEPSMLLLAAIPGTLAVASRRR